MTHPNVFDPIATQKEVEEALTLASEAADAGEFLNLFEKVLKPAISRLASDAVQLAMHLRLHEERLDAIEADEGSQLEPEHGEMLEKYLELSLQILRNAQKAMPSAKTEKLIELGENCLELVRGITMPPEDGEDGEDDGDDDADA